MPVGDILKKYSEAESELLLAHVLHRPKEFLHLHPETRVTAPQKAKFLKLHTDFKKDVPMAYLLGYKYFYGLKFALNRHVLIPRPESEWLVERGLDYIKKHPRAKRVLDMGTGSGAIIVSLAATTRSSMVNRSGTTRAGIEWLGADISKSALAVAKQNARTHKTSVKFIHSNLFESVPGKFDLIIANLPYVPANDYKKLYSNLKYEPKKALTDKTNNSITITQFLEQLGNRLNKYSLILMEIDPTSKPIIQRVAKPLQLKLNFHKDYKGLTRYSTIIKSPR